MVDYFDKLWLQSSLNQTAASRAMEAVQTAGMALPCSVTAVNGPIVTVRFEVVKSVAQPDGTVQQVTLPTLRLPKAESQWLRAPTQVGDFGLTLPASTVLGGISGLGSGTPDLSVQYGNLSSLVFIPVASTAFSTSPDANKAWLNGPNGAMLSDAAQTVSVTADKGSGQVVIKAGSLSFVLDKNTGTVQIAGSGTASGDAVVRQSDLQAALNAWATTLQTWAATHFQTGTSTPPAPTTPTATGSAKTFTA